MKKPEIESRIATVSVAVAYGGKATVAIVELEGGLGLGVALCMESDKYSKEIGANIAVARAIRDIADNMEKTWVARATTKKDWEKKHKKG